MPFSLDPLPGEDEYECARCGAIVRYDLTRCPQCGVNLYEPEDEAVEAVPPRPPAASGGFLEPLRQLWRQITGQPHPAETLFGAAQQQQTLYHDLLRKVGGDHAAAERLIAFERQQRPNAPRAVWLQNAIGRWERDND